MEARSYPMAPFSIKMGGEYPKGDVATERPAQLDAFGLPVGADVSATLA